MKPGAPPTSKAATRAFGRWLHARYGNIHGYWTCPPEQVFGDDADCLAEVHGAQTYHLTSATARLSGNGIEFVQVNDSAWVRRWSPYSAAVVAGAGGRASVNSPHYDWEWIGRQLAAPWQRRRGFNAWGYDGNGAGLGRFYAFRCLVARSLLVTCRNALGDAIRYRPVPPIVFVHGLGGVWGVWDDGSSQRRLSRIDDADPRWSRDHRWIAFARSDFSRPQAAQEIWLMRPDGSDKHQLTRTYPGQAWAPTWSPDGKRIAFVGQRAGANPIGIWVTRLDGSKPIIITSNTDDNEPAWSPDGAHIAFVRGVSDALYVMDANGRNAHRVLKALPRAFGGCQQGWPSWSPDSKRIVFSCADRVALWIVDVDGRHAHRLVTGSQADWSPDGRWIVFSAPLARGPGAIYKIHPDGSGLRRLTHNRYPAGTGGDDAPDW
jgi:hypothetical protein